MAAEKAAAAAGSAPCFSLEDVRKHCFQDDAWTVYDGRVLRLTEFIRHHPGGDAVICLAAGIDSTILVRTYHPNGVPEAVVDRLTIGRLASQPPCAAAADGAAATSKSPELASSYYSWDSPFYKTMQRRVVERLRELRRPRRGGIEIWVKALLLLALFWGSLWVMISAGWSNSSSDVFWSRAVPASIVMGATASFIGTCVQHDGNHAAFATWGWLNRLSGWTLDMIGASAFTWEIQHMLGHHPYTNLLDVEGEKCKTSGRSGPSNCQESDPDVFSSFPFIRMHPAHPRLWYHRFQHLFAPFLFALMTLSKVFAQDWDMFSKKRLYHISAECRYSHAPHNIARFLLMKLLSFGYMVVLPCASHGIGRGLILFVLGHIVCGEMLATMFIVNHVIEGVAFAQRGASGSDNFEEPKDADGRKAKAADSKNSTVVPANDWAAVQCQTSVNWAPGSWFWNHFSGGLNHQIEHHLFPSICHTNYVHIQPVVEATCREFNVPYRSEASLWSAYTKMISHLRRMGCRDSHPSWQSLA